MEKAMTKKILVATDGSQTGVRAVAYAAELSRKLGSDLSIVHVLLHGRPSNELRRLAEVENLVEAAKVPDPFAHRGFLGADRSPEQELEDIRVVGAFGEEILTQAKEAALGASAQNVTTHLCAGDYADEILEVAETEGVDMIVVGRRGLGRLREILLGSVSQKILHHAPCTVVVAR